MQKIKNFILTLVPFLFLVTGFGFRANGQLSSIHDYRRVDSIRVTNENYKALLFPFAGGLNSCQFSNMDINLDGIDDLLVFDRHGFRILPFIINPANPAELQFRPEFVHFFPPLEQWMQAMDYNSDGRKDIFTYTTGGIKVYRNDSENELKFTLVTNPFLLSLQGSTLTNILVTYADYPAIADIDADGDLDVLTFWGLGSFVEWHKNTSVERFGTTDSLTFEKASSCWGHFAEGNENNSIVLDTCMPAGLYKTGDGTSSDDPKHTGSTLLVHDLNGDGLPDLTLGDVDFSNLVHLTNGGSQADAKMISQTNNFPNATAPVNMSTFPAAMLADVNNDGKKDLLVSPFDPSLIKGENYASISLYLNSGSSAHPVFNLASENFLQAEMLDFGSGAYPVFFDYNGDGLMDLLVGNYGYSDTCIFTPETGLKCTFISKIALMLNTGTSLKPAFTLADRNIAHLDSLQMQSLIPTIADMDGDGDGDLICGNSKGKLVYCENVAEPGQPADFKLKDPAWKQISVGDYSAPQLIDMDNDGLTDLICGKRNGTISFYKNTGSVHEAQFELVTDQFGGVDVTNTQLSNFGYCTPCFYKNSRGEAVLFSGSEFGEIFVFDQITNNLDGTFRFFGTLPGIHEGWRSSVALSGLNGDTLADIVLGNYSGGLEVFSGIADKLFGISNQEQEKDLPLIVTPNPAVSVATLTVTNLNAHALKLVIQSVDGNILKELYKPGFPLEMDVSELRNGIYIITLFTNQGIHEGKIVVCR